MAGSEAGPRAGRWLRQNQQKETDMADEMKHPTPPKLPGDHGQFGTSDATEDYKRLKDLPKPTPDPKEVNQPGP